ncbi:hypothetical protein AVEN_275447-1, partial [Araneus ventricosus]
MQLIEEFTYSNALWHFVSSRRMPVLMNITKSETGNNRKFDRETQTSSQAFEHLCSQVVFLNLWRHCDVQK